VEDQEDRDFLDNPHCYVENDNVSAHNNPILLSMIVSVAQDENFLSDNIL